MPSIWMDVDAAIIVPVNISPLLDDTDFKTIEEAIVYDSAGIAITWNFVTTAGVVTGIAIVPTAAGDYDWSEPLANVGMYAIEIPAVGGASANNDTEGFGWITGVATGVVPWHGPVIGFRAAGLNNLLVDAAYVATRGLAGTALPNAVADAAFGLPISDAGGLDLDAILADTNELQADDYPTSIAAIKAETALIVADTNELQTDDYPASIAAVKAETALIVADTNELQTDDYPASIAAIKAETALIVADTAEIGAAGVGLTEAGGDGDHLTEAGGTGNHLTAINLPNQTMNIIGDITGDLSGSVGSVTGAVGSVTAEVDADITRISGDPIAADTLELFVEALDQLDGQIDSGTFHAGAINAAALAGDCITAAKIADDAIAAEHIAAGAIVAATLSPDCINASKIADDAIGPEHIGAGAIVAATFGAGAINAAVIANGAIDAATFAAGAIDAAAIAANAIGASEIAAGAIDAVTFAAGAINNAAIAAGAITNTEATSVGAVIGAVGSVTGHTPQTGDSFARLGAPAGASIAADVLVIDNFVDELETRLSAVRAGYLDELAAANIPADVDTLTTRLSAVRAGYLDELAAANIPTDLTNIEADTQDVQARIPAALIAGRMSSDSEAISGSTGAADRLEASAETIVTGAAVAGTLSTTQMTTDLTEVTNDHYNGRVVIWTSGVLQDQATDITDYDGPTKMLDYTATTEAPGIGDTFVIV